MEKKNNPSLANIIFQDTGWSKMNLREKFLISYLTITFLLVMICAESLTAEAVVIPNMALALYLCKKYNVFDKIPEDD